MIVEVYRNLHKGMYSIRKDGVVIAHAPSVTLSNPKFKVSAAGRDRVRREKRKNVHAVVKGELIGIGETPCIVDPVLISYNPYVNETFVATSGTPANDFVGHEHGATFAHLDENYKIKVW